METKDHLFQKLTLKSDVKLETYQEALDFVFENNDLKNIAITGAYGAGKSSVLESYKRAKQNPKKFLHITLTYFSPDSQNNQQTSQNNSDKGTSENVLEGKILNQLIHQIDASKIPQTNFRVKHKVSKLKTLTLAVSLIFNILWLIYCVNFPNWHVYINDLPVNSKNVLAWITNPVVLLVGSAITIVSWCFYIYLILLAQQNKSIFKKVSVQGNEIEIFEQCEDSYFDKYLNEVIYLFENSGADVIVFEDLDRFCVNQIFQRLREVNTLINNRRKNLQPIRFFYLLRDDIFISKDRTKFFDFIIPVIPILDGSNSYDKFLEIFAEENTSIQFDQYFLQGVSLYVDDMRILKNIYNEFTIYNSRINTTEQNHNKLLAMIIYKNLFPKDFSDLQLNQGFVYLLFTKKGSLIIEKKKGIHDQISGSEEEINKIESEALRTEQELDTLYQNHPNHNRYDSLSPKLQQELNTRKDYLKKRNDGYVGKLQLKIKEFEKELVQIEEKKLSEILSKENIDDFFKINFKDEIGNIVNFNEIKSNEYFPLLKYLIRNGYIDETYPDYMTYFYENSLSRNDKIFLRSVTDESAKSYSYGIRNPELVANRLKAEDFKHEEVLNFDLFSFLLQHQKDHVLPLEYFGNQLKDNRHLEFVRQYFSAKRETEFFIKFINHLWPELFSDLLITETFPDELKKEFALMSINFSPEEDLKAINADNNLSDFVANCSDFLQIDAPDIPRIMSAFQLLEIKFKFIDFKKSNSKLLRKIYTENLYELNYEMVSAILENLYRLQKDINFRRKNLSLILSKPDEPLAKYIQNDIDIETYMDIVINNNDGAICDDEKFVLFVLNHPILTTKTKNLYINLLQTKILSINSITDHTLWQTLIEKDLIIYTPNNVLHYFSNNNYVIDSILTNFINTKGEIFDTSREELEENFGSDCILKFFNAIINCAALNNSRYAVILGALDLSLESFLYSGINEQKIDILISQNKIQMNRANLIFMREHYSEKKMHITFITRNISDYIERTLNSDILDFSETLEILDSNVDDTYKIKLIKLTVQPISIINTNYSVTIKALIVVDNFNLNDLPELLKTYGSLPDMLQKSIYKIIPNHIQTIFNNRYTIHFQLLINILSDNSFPDSNKFDLFLINLPNFNQEQCKQSLQVLGENELLSLFVGKRPKFNSTEQMKKVFDIFKQKGWISSYKNDDATGTIQAFGSRAKRKRKA